MIRLNEAFYGKFLEILAKATGPEVPLKLFDDRTGHEHWLRPTGPARSSRVPVSCETCGVTGKVVIRMGSSGLHLAFEEDDAEPGRELTPAERGAIRSIVAQSGHLEIWTGPPPARPSDVAADGARKLSSFPVAAMPDPEPEPEGSWRDRPPLL